MNQPIIVYAVGGTGAKLLEALVHLCACGIVRRPLRIRFVDQDQGNGNMLRARATLAAYSAAHAAAALGSGRPFFSSIDWIREPLIIVPDAEATLASAYGLGQETHCDTEDDNEILMQALFTDAERAQAMNIGFRGQPRVGAAVYLSRPAREGALGRQLDADIGEAQNNKVGGFMLLGSAFGGTGASGVPTLATYLRDAKNLHRLATPVGAVLTLRYFGVTKGSRFGPVEPEHMKAVLEYYGTSFRMPAGGGTARFLDSLYLVGLDPEIVIPAEQTGGGPKQANRALVPELIGALGAAHFINNLPDLSSGAAVANHDYPVWLAGYGNDKTIDWADLPDAMPDGSAEPASTLLCRFIRFALYFRYHLHISEKLSSVPGAADWPMYNNFLTLKLLRDGEYDERAGAINKFAEMFLIWLGSMHADGLTAPGSAISLAARLGLAAFDALLNDKPENDSDAAMTKLRWRYSTGGELPPAAKRLLEQLNDARAPNMARHSIAKMHARMAASLPNKRGVPAWVAAAYAASTAETPKP